MTAVIGQGGVAADNGNGGFSGSLTNFESGKGYWIVTDADLDFSYLPASSASRMVNPYQVAEKPVGLDFIQSSEQAFYFIDQIDLLEGGIESGDWLVSYCGNTVAGSRLYLGEEIDIPVMGYDGYSSTAGYCESGDTPNFKLLKSDSNELVSLNADIP